MGTEIKKKKQTMMCVEKLKLNNVKNKKLKSQTVSKISGITLIALVVTIVVLLILAGITISLVFSENGIIAKAKEAAEKTNQAAINEQEQMNGLGTTIENMLNGTGGSGEETTPPEPTLPSDGSYSEEKGVNTPNLEEGMTAIKWDEAKNDWIETTGSDQEWYDYTAKKWANAKTSDGSMWVWIPRYAYQIADNYHTNSVTGGTIEIKFLKDSSNVAYDVTSTWDNVSGQGKWNVHPAFNYGQEVSGLWVAKFEASSKEGNSNNSGDNVTTKTLQVKPGVSSWRNIEIGNMYTVCKNYNSILNSHMMKNDEWGAVAYLSKSKYGKENEELWINNSSSFITGSAGNNAIANADVGTTTDYTSTQGVKASTTGTVYGVYDMSGGAHEYVAAYVDNGNSNLTKYGSSLVNGESKTKNMYSKGSTDNRENNYSTNSGKYGDAVYETSANGNSNNSSWYNDYSPFPYTSDPFFGRGGDYSIGMITGAFCFGSSSGEKVGHYSFRPVLVAI